MSTEFPAPEIVEITPDIAREWLGFNTHNRRLRNRTVQAYAWDMLSGNWQWNGESVKFAADGTLLDGQHRLAAVAEAGVPVQMLVLRGLPAAIQDTVDGGIRRLFSDVLTLRGEADSTHLAAIVRRVAYWENGNLATRSNYQISNTRLLQVLENHPELRDIAKASRVVSLRTGLPGSVCGFCMWLFGQLEDSDADVDFFFERLVDFQGLQKGDAIYELRRTIESSRSYKGMRSEIFLTAVTIKAWNAFREGKEVGLLRFRSGGAAPEKFPVAI